MSTDIDDRVRALERALTERDDPAGPIPDITDVNATANEFDDRVSALESRMADLTARQQAVEAYVDRIEHVNESIERRADAALAAVDRLEPSEERPPAATPDSESDFEPDTGSKSHQTVNDRPNHPGGLDTNSVHPSHVTDAARTGTPPDEETDAASDGLIARLIGL